MKGNMARTIQAVLFVTALCISMASAAKAETPKCNPALIAGKWANSGSGIFNGATFVFVELATVDADGNFESKITSSSDGVSLRGILIGQIKAEDDCTATASWTSYVLDESGNKMVFGFGTADMVADDDIRQERFVFTSYRICPSLNCNFFDAIPVRVTVKGEGRKVFPRSSDQQ